MSMIIRKPYIIRLRFDNILLFVETFLVVRPSYLDTLFGDVPSYLLLGFLFIEVLLSIRAFKPSKLIVLIIGSVFYHFVITLAFHSMGFQTATMKAVTPLLCVMMIWRRLKVDRFSTVHIVALAFWWLLTVNFFSVLLFPNGLTQGYSVSLQFHRSFFLGVDNQFGKILFPGLALILFDEEYRGEKYHFASIMAVIVTLSTYLIRMSGGGLVSIFIFLMAYFVYRKNSSSAFISYKTMFLLLVFLYIGVIGGSSIIYSNRLFLNLTTVIGKDTTMSGRTYIWKIGLMNFLKHPIFGIGWQPRDAVIILSAPYSAHNRLLQTLLEGGIIGGIFLILLLVGSMVRSAKISEKIQSIRILSIGIFITFIYFMVETGTLDPVYIIIIIIAGITDLEINKSGTRV